MSFLSGLCGCFAPKYSPRSPSAPAPSQAMAQTHHHHHHNNSNFPSHHHPDEGPVYMTFDEDGYTPPIPLPRYTPRPMSSMQEKTLEAHMRDPPISSSRSIASLHDEKNPRDFTSTDGDEHELTSDVSSAISFPSSYGNTSTATRETPPPPYSPRISPAPSRSMSISSLYPPPLPPPPPMAHIAQPRPVLRRECLPRDLAGRGRVSFESQGQRRFSWESR